MMKWLHDLVSRLVGSYSTHQKLTIAMVFALLFILFSELFYESRAFFEGAEKLSGILSNIALSYIAAYIFYYLSIYLPKENEKKLMSEHLARLSDDIHSSLFHVIDDAATRVSRDICSESTG